MCRAAVVLGDLEHAERRRPRGDIDLGSRRAMQIELDLVDREARLLLCLEAAFEIGLGMRAADEHGCQACHDDAEDRHDDEHLHERVAALATHHFALASTSASARRASSWLLPPIP